jgi:hypothetical protein
MHNHLVEPGVEVQKVTSQTTWFVILSNLDSIVVTCDDKPLVLPPCHSMHAHAKILVHQQS